MKPTKVPPPIFPPSQDVFTKSSDTLERAGVSDPHIPPVIDKHVAQNWLSEIIESRPTLRSMATREAAWRVLAPIVKDDASMDAKSLHERMRALGNTVILRPDGYFASLTTGDPVARNQDERLQVGRTYILKDGVLHDGDRVVGKVAPLDDRMALHAVIGAGRSIDDLIASLRKTIEHPVDTLGPILPNIAQLIVSSPDYYERFVAMPPAAQAEALGGLAMNVALFVLSGKSGPGPFLETVQINAGGALAIASTTVVVDEAAVLAMTLHLAEALRPKDVKMDHIARGEVVSESRHVKGRWQKLRLAKGFHLEHASPHARVVPGTQTAMDKHGVYRARVEIHDPKTGQWIPKRSMSTFFPKHYSEADALRAVEEAFGSCVDCGTSFIGKSNDGLTIQIFADESGVVVAAFPIQGL